MYYVYILLNKSNDRTYVGHAYDLKRRVWEHKNHVNPDSHTARYNITKLVYFECGDDVNAAIDREKQIKGGSRQSKIDMINEMNPEWKDLYDEL